MKDTIFYVGGGKGGVGKSMVSLTLVQFIIDRFGDRKAIHLVETDESNPDVGRIYKGKIPVSNIILDEEEKGWIVLSELIEKNRETIFVINSAARSNMGIRKNGKNFSAVLESGRVPYDFVTFWPMNRQKDSIFLLEDYLKYITAGSVYPVLNNYFGASDDFTLFAKHLNESPSLKFRIRDALDFPALADIIADDFYTGGKTIPETVPSLSAFAEQSFLSWRNQVYAMFESTGEFEADSDYDTRDDAQQDYE